MDSPTDTLRQEHRLILRALEGLDSAADRLAAEGAPPESWAALVAWLSSFADANHHAKEERCLFPALVKAGVPDQGGPIAVMLAEHDEGRALIRAMTEGDAAGRRHAAARYAALLRAHIDKENGVLFPMADAVLDEAAQAAVRRQFEAVEAEQGRAASAEWAEAQLAALGPAPR